MRVTFEGRRPCNYATLSQQDFSIENPIWRFGPRDRPELQFGVKIDTDAGGYVKVCFPNRADGTAGTSGCPVNGEWADVFYHDDPTTPVSVEDRFFDEWTTEVIIDHYNEKTKM